jgi:formiminotetrahydrofolate cyclodeaminase
VTLADAQLAELLQRIADRTPAPGGGAGAAIGGALAAALVEMAAAFASCRPGAEDNIANARNRATILRARLLALADEDARAYQPVIDALALPHADPHRTEAIAAALSAAAEPPLQIATAAAEVTELAVAAATAPGNEHLLGDATTAAVLAEAATKAATRLVELNLGRSPDDVRRTEAHELAQRAAASRAYVERLSA